MGYKRKGETEDVEEEDVEVEEDLPDEPAAPQKPSTALARRPHESEPEGGEADEPPAQHVHGQQIQSRHPTTPKKHAPVDEHVGLKVTLGVGAGIAAGIGIGMALERHRKKKR